MTKYVRPSSSIDTHVDTHVTRTSCMFVNTYTAADNRKACRSWVHLPAQLQQLDMCMLSCKRTDGTTYERHKGHLSRSYTYVLPFKISGTKTCIVSALPSIHRFMRLHRVCVLCTECSNQTICTGEQGDPTLTDSFRRLDGVPAIYIWIC